MSKDQETITMTLKEYSVIVSHNYHEGIRTAICVLQDLVTEENKKALTDRLLKQFQDLVKGKQP